jgi:hypothetical protein
MLQAILLELKTCTQMTAELRETPWQHAARYLTRCLHNIKTLNLQKKEIKDSGILTFLTDCTGNGEEVMIRSATVRFVNRTQKDILSHLCLSSDCCETGGHKTHVHELQLHRQPLQNLLSHNELELATFNEDGDVWRLTEEQDWKLRHCNRTHRLPVLTSTGALLFALLNGSLCRCCRNCWPKIYEMVLQRRSRFVVFKPRTI